MKVTLKQILRDRLKAYPEHEKFKWYSYSDYKARFYVYLSAPLIYIFLGLKISPNAITLLYILLGIFGGVCLAVDRTAFVYTGIIIFFLRPILDWCDGAVAGYRGLKSLEGHCLDVFGAYSGWIAFWIGIGFYAYHKTGYSWLIYTIPLVPLLFALDIKSFFRSILLESGLGQLKISSGKIQKDVKGVNCSAGVEFVNSAPSEKKTVNNFIYRTMNFIAVVFFEHKARVVDTICLIILIELNIKLNIVWIYYLAFLTFEGLYYLLTFCYFLKGNFVKMELEKLADFRKS